MGYMTHVGMAYEARGDKALVDLDDHRRRSSPHSTLAGSIVDFINIIWPSALEMFFLL